MFRNLVSRKVWPRELSARQVAQAAQVRDPQFKTVSREDIFRFKSIVGDSGVILDPSDLQPFNNDWLNRFSGRATVALKPKTTQDISAIMAYCHENRIAVVPQGGNTGLVGGSVPVFDEVVISTTGMSSIEEFDIHSGVAVAQAGVVLEMLESHVGSHGYRVPLDLGAKGSCQIGGNVATNAGGSRFIRFGSLRGSVLGIEAVLPDGRILDTLTSLPKDNTGYDVKQLMIGGEGTLGIITRVAIQCVKKSASVETVVLRLSSFEDVKELLLLAKDSLGETLSAFEFMDAESIKLAAKNLTHVNDPLDDGDDESEQDSAGTVLIEVAGANEEHNREKMERFVETAFERDLVSNGVIAENETQSTAMWELRESLPEALLKAGNGGTLKYDVSVPLSRFYRMVEEGRERVRDFGAGVHVVGWGHIGDRNLHLNVAIESGVEKEEVQACLEPWVYEFVRDCRGSVSAEHGLGVMKAGAIGYSKGPVAVEVMRAVKQVLDERGICNPYKMLPEE